ncbi:alpha-amylase family glycosyl hydrolase, partial [Staphylococcus aureus]
KNDYLILKPQGGDLDALLPKYKADNRDHSRTPIQWDATVTGGFTKGAPWFPLTPNYTSIHASQQL